MRYLENKKFNKKLYSFRQNHSSSIINRRLDYIFISNHFKNFLMTQTLFQLLKPIILLFQLLFPIIFFKPSPGIWKFNNSLIKDETFINTFKNFTKNMINELNTNTSLNNQLEWTLLKYKMRRFTISYCKQRTKKDERERK